MWINYANGSLIAVNEGADIDIGVKAKVIYESDTDDIINQYIVRYEPYYTMDVYKYQKAWAEISPRELGGVLLKYFS